MKRIGKALILAGVLLFLGIMISMIGIGYIIGDSSHRKDTTGTVQNTVETVKYETKTYIYIYIPKIHFSNGQIAALMHP